MVQNIHTQTRTHTHAHVHTHTHIHTHTDPTHEQHRSLTCLVLLKSCGGDSPGARYKEEGTPTIILAGAEYGSGSSRDWAAKGTSNPLVRIES